MNRTLQSTIYIMVVGILGGVVSAEAQIGFRDVFEGEGGRVFVGAANMDTDSQLELVFADGSGDTRIFIVDGLTGTSEWQSPTGQMYLAGYSWGDGDTYGHSPFVDIEGDGISELVAYGSNGTQYGVFIIGLVGTAATGNSATQPDTEMIGLKSFPNPFNARTTMEYQVEKAGEVTIEIFDVRGRLIRSLLNKHVEAGIHRTEWDGRSNAGRSMASGTYYYRLTVGNRVICEKSLLLK